MGTQPKSHLIERQSFPNNNKQAQNRVARQNRQRRLQPRIYTTPMLRGPFMAMARASPFPEQYKATVSYTSYGSLTTGTAGICGSEYSFRLNSIYDPDETSTGRQPYGHDQLQLLYTQYFVDKCRVRITAYDPSADGVVLCCMLIPGYDTTSLTGAVPEQVAERPMAIVLEVASTGEQRRTIAQDVDIAAIQGLTRQEISAGSLYRSLFGANPSTVPRLKIAAGSVRAEGSVTIIFRVDLTYHVTCTGRIVQSSS
jgi:hypothetical protein